MGIVGIVLLVGVVAGIILAAAMDPDNRRKTGSKWQDDTEYFGL